MGGLDELEAAALDKRDVAALELEFEIERMKAGTEEHCDLAQLDTLLAQFQDALGYETRLHMLVLRANQQRTELAAALGGKNLGVFVRGARYDFIGDVEDALQRAIVLLELDHARAGEDFLRKVHDVAKVGAAKRIDRLRVVAHRHHVAMGRGEQSHQLGLN